jgi:hypothetical protein
LASLGTLLYHSGPRGYPCETPCVLRPRTVRFESARSGRCNLYESHPAQSFNIMNPGPAPEHSHFISMDVFALSSSTSPLQQQYQVGYKIQTCTLSTALLRHILFPIPPKFFIIPAWLATHAAHRYPPTASSANSSRRTAVTHPRSRPKINRQRVFGHIKS